MDTKHAYWRFIGIFLIVLTLSLPVYSASSLAAIVQIEGNSGQAGLEGFLDGEGDVWTVSAKISQLAEGETVAADNVQIKLGANVQPFTSCSAEGDVVVCTYLEGLESGIAGGSYPFSVTYTPISGTPAVAGNIIQVDAEAPVISFTQGGATQVQGSLQVDFTVQDSGVCVGLQKIEILDADTGSVLHTISDFAETDCSAYTSLTASGFNGVLPASFTGEGLRKLKILAEDRLGHAAVSNVVLVQTDFVAPEIDTNLNFTSLNEFIGGLTVTSDLIVTVTETNKLTSVIASGSGTNLDKTPAQCSRDGSAWRCRWSAVSILPQETVTISIIAQDEFGNLAEQELKRTFVKDDSLPEIEYFGAARQFNDVGYIRDGENTIVLKVREQGAGIDHAGIAVNLGDVGGSSNTLADADDCLVEDELFVCRWQRSASTAGKAVAKINVATLKDNVGNLGTLAHTDLLVDTTRPQIEKLEFFGGTNDFFQSHQPLKVTLTVNETTGLFVAIDMRELLNDAETDYPATEFTPAGFATFTEDNCQRVNGLWECTLETKPLKSGVGSTADFTLTVQDTAGNEVAEYPAIEHAELLAPTNGEYRLTLFGIENDPNPDYWGVVKITNLLPFIDLDVVELGATRMVSEASLRSNYSEVSALQADLIGCQAAEGNQTAIEINRAYMYGAILDNEKNPQPKLVVEFAPIPEPRKVFNIKDEKIFTEAVVPIDCTINIFSQVGAQSTQAAEQQTVTLQVPFAFSDLGALDENLEKNIEDIKNEVGFEIADTLSVLADILAYLQYFANLVQAVLGIINFVNVLTTSEESIRTIPGAAGIAAGLCVGNQQVQNSIESSIIEYIQIPLNLLSCNPDPSNLGWYGQYQKGVLNTYNAISGRGLIGMGASSLYENIYTSMIGLCIPGIVYNLEKYRQVRCREIMCYQNEVPRGVATVDSCKNLGEYLECVYWSGPAFDLTPLALWDTVIEFVASLGSSPLGLIRVALSIPCLGACAGSNTLAATCKWTASIIKIGDLIELVVNAINTWPSKVNNYYCSQVDL